MDCNATTEEILDNIFKASVITTNFEYFLSDARAYFLSDAREEVRTRCDDWKNIREQNSIILMTNFNKTFSDKLINELNKVRDENCPHGELPIKWMLYGILIFAAVATLIATIFHLWRKDQDKKLALKLKFALAMSGNFNPDEMKKLENLWGKMYIDANFIEVKKDFIRGKGSTSIVNDALLHTKAPISELHPCLETSKFKFCPAVIKIANNFSIDEYKHVCKEVAVALKIGNHRHVCCLLGWTIYLKAYSLIYEHIDGGNLLSWIKCYANDKEVVTDTQIAKILWQITDGMEYLSMLGIVHKDLAARNILITKTFEIKISDFGLASFCGIDSLYYSETNQKLPIRWMAVESFCQIFSEASDIWSFGIIIWELFTFGQIPYGDMSNEEIMKFIVDGNRLNLPSSIGQPWQMLAHDCWKSNRNDRPTFTAIKGLLKRYLENKTIDYGYLSCKN
uniref:receptor protein-tyrosine kinase n=1 Tax=Panagrolaimus davidi TaxID=227884 RepID=A0A914Q1C0_9BILA